MVSEDRACFPILHLFPNNPSQANGYAWIEGEYAALKPLYVSFDMDEAVAWRAGGSVGFS